MVPLKSNFFESPPFILRWERFTKDDSIYKRIVLSLRESSEDWILKSYSATSSLLIEKPHTKGKPRD